MESPNPKPLGLIGVDPTPNGGMVILSEKGRLLGKCKLQSEDPKFALVTWIEEYQIHSAYIDMLHILDNKSPAYNVQRLINCGRHMERIFLLAQCPVYSVEQASWEESCGSVYKVNTTVINPVNVGKAIARLHFNENELRNLEIKKDKLHDGLVNAALIAFHGLLAESLKTQNQQKDENTHGQSTTDNGTQESEPS